MRIFACILALSLLLCSTSLQSPTTSVVAQPANTPVCIPWPAGLPVYDHIVIVVMENKNYEHIIL
jgi:hypothetical protein